MCGSCPFQRSGRDARRGPVLQEEPQTTVLGSLVLEAGADSFHDRTERFTSDLRLGPVDVSGVAQARAGELAVGGAAPPAIDPVLAVTLAGQVLDVVPLAFPLGRRTALARQVRGVLGVQTLRDQGQAALGADGRRLSGAAWSEPAGDGHGSVAVKKATIGKVTRESPRAQEGPILIAGGTRRWSTSRSIDHSNGRDIVSKTASPASVTLHASWDGGRRA